MANPFDPKTVLLAKHAQHVVLVHFPIALFITAVGFDFLAQWTKRKDVAAAAFYNLEIAAFSTIPVLATGLLAWQLQLEGEKLKGVLLMHLIFACVSTVMIWLVWWVHRLARQKEEALPNYRLALEILAIAAVAVTGHLGGFVSGVNERRRCRPSRISQMHGLGRHRPRLDDERWCSRLSRLRQRLWTSRRKRGGLHVRADQ